MERFLRKKRLSVSVQISGVERAREEQVLLPASCLRSQAPQQKPRHRPIVKGVRQGVKKPSHAYLHYGAGVDSPLLPH